jgi:membrane peptidoglycan carboxypeptidase
VFDETGRPGERVLDPEVAACAASILHGPLGPGGTAAGKGVAGHDAFGKTGTTDNEVTSAFIGATPDLAAFAWHGVPEADVPGAGFGAGVPNAMWREFMNRALQGKPDTPFPAPGPACDAPGKVIDPNAGRTDRDARPPAPPEPPPLEFIPLDPGQPPPPAPAPAPAPAPPPESPFDPGRGNGGGGNPGGGGGG